MVGHRDETRRVVRGRALGAELHGAVRRRLRLAVERHRDERAGKIAMNLRLVGTQVRGDFEERDRRFELVPPKLQGREGVVQPRELAEHLAVDARRLAGLALGPKGRAEREYVVRRHRGSSVLVFDVTSVGVRVRGCVHQHEPP